MNRLIQPSEELETPQKPGYTFDVVEDLIALTEMFEALHKAAYSYNTQGVGMMAMALKSFLDTSRNVKQDAKTAIDLLSRFAEMDAFFARYARFVEHHLSDLNDANEKAMMA